MNYYINPATLTSAFTLPSAVADDHLKLAKGDHIKVLLFLFRNMANDFSEKDIADACGLDEYDVKEALLYWADSGILLPKEAANDKSKEKKPIISSIKKPSRADVLKRGMEDEKIRYLIQEAQIKLCRNLKGNETNTLVWLYDDQGLDVSLILLIIQYAVSQDKANIRFIESVAVSFVEKGIDNIAAADEELRKMAESDKCWNIVTSAFGIEKRKPSKKESELSLKWIEEWKIPKEMLVSAYDECINKKSKFIFSYIATIIENWHKNGFQSAEDANKARKDGKNDFVSYDIDLYEKMLNSKD